MRIFITGLCLQGNKGGPAIALALKDLMQRSYGTAEFVFSVPSGDEFQYEKIWSKRYGVEIVEKFSIRDFVPSFRVGKYRAKLKRIVSWIKWLKKSDVVVEMSAISYVGPPTGSQRNVWLDGRFHYFLISRFLNKPFFAWTQSYGPFSTPLIRFLAKMDLGSQPVVFCRGEETLNKVQELLPYKEARSYPDVAVLLNYDREWGSQYIKSIIDKVDFRKLITLSPSSVIYSKTTTTDGINLHVDRLVSLCKYLTSMGYTVLLVPHVFRPNRHNPNICDFAVSQMVLERMQGDQSVSLVADDLSPIELKSIISNAYIHIGARYHSIIAALSSGIPCISLSWHHKYVDVMQMYEMEHFVFDEMGSAPLDRLLSMVDQLASQNSTYRDVIAKRQIQAKLDVEKNAQEYFLLMEKAIK